MFSRVLAVSSLFVAMSVSSFAETNQEGSGSFDADGNRFVCVNGQKCVVGCGGLVFLKTGEVVPEEYVRLSATVEQAQVVESDDLVDLTADMDDLQKSLFKELAEGKITVEEAELIENSRNRPVNICEVQ